MNLGFDGDLATVAAASGVLAKALYPLVSARRRVDSDADGTLDDTGRGELYLREDFHPHAVAGILAAMGVGFAIVVGEPLFPVLSAVASGFMAERLQRKAVDGVRGGR